MESQNSCGALIKQIHDELKKQSNNSLRPMDLTMAQVGTLLSLRDAQGGQMPLKQLEQVLHVAQSTAAGIAARLEQKGLVESSGDPEDRRIKVVRITGEGLKCCDDADRNMAETESQILSGLTEAERSIFQTLLQKVRDTLQ